MQGHVLPLRAYLLVFAALLVLTGVTTGVAFVHLGVLNDFVAMTIAVVKALLVALFFMHLRSSSKLVWIVAGAGITWLLMLFVLSLADYRTRAVVEGWSAVGGS